MQLWRYWQLWSIEVHRQLVLRRQLWIENMPVCDLLQQFHLNVLKMQEPNVTVEAITEGAICAPASQAVEGRETIQEN